MLDVRPTAYVVPLDEQTIGPLTPIIHIENLADESANITGLVRIYRESLGTLIFSSVLHPTYIAHGQSADVSTETEFNPGAPADDDYFILCAVTARSTLTGNEETIPLGQFYFDVKPSPMGPIPATHHTTHENGGMDEVDVSGLSGLLADGQTPANHATTHEDGGADQISLSGLHGTLADTQPPFEPQTLTDGAAIDWDLALGGSASVTLRGNRTLNAPSNMVDGHRYSLRLIQDGTGTRLLTWVAAYRFPGGVKPCLTATASAFDIILFACDGSHLDCIGMTSALA